VTSRETAALMRESAQLHLATVALFATLPPRMRSKHLAPKAERIARALELAAGELEAREVEA
jgi:hypothetical protein